MLTHRLKSKLFYMHHKNPYMKVYMQSGLSTCRHKNFPFHLNVSKNYCFVHAINCKYFITKIDLKTKSTEC